MDRQTYDRRFDWQMDDQLTLRATRSRDIRAPTLSDLYFPHAVFTALITDRLTCQTPLATAVSGGNPDLVPEAGYTTTAGIVYQPEWLTNFSVTLDAFWITIRNAITQGTSPYCSLQQRPNGITDTSPSNAATEWVREEINIASQHTQGGFANGDDPIGRYFTAGFRLQL